MNRRHGEALAMRTFRFSIWYLVWLFALLLSDHYLLFLRFLPV